VKFKESLARESRTFLFVVRGLCY